MKQIARYIDNALFIKWVFEPDEDLHTYWSLYMKRHPEEQALIRALRNELGSIRVSGPRLTAAQKEKLADRIFAEMQKKQRREKMAHTVKIFRNYAALAVLFFLLGALVVLLTWQPEEHTWQAHDMEIPAVVDRPLLVLGNGNIIDLPKENLALTALTENGLIVNGDSLIPVHLDKAGLTSNVQLLVPYGTRAKVILADQTEVWLNAGSRLVYTPVFSKRERRVHLFGEAYFQVAKNDRHPFVVQTADYAIKVTGTSFNVSAYPMDQVSYTMLTEGRVSVYPNGKNWMKRPVNLKPNDLFEYHKDSHQTRIGQADTANYILWKEGTFLFKDEGLDMILKKLERYYNIRIELANPADGNMKLHGKLQLESDINSVIYYVSSVANREFIKKNERHYIIR